MISFLLSILYGALAGWISSRIMKTTGGTLRNIITGIVGGMIGSFLFGLIGFYAHGFLANIDCIRSGCMHFYLYRQKAVWRHKVKKGSGFSCIIQEFLPFLLYR